MKKCFVALASPIHDKEMVNEVVEKILSSLLENTVLQDKGLITNKKLLSYKLNECDIIVSLVVTGGSEELIIETSMIEKPVIFLAHSTMNSLPALIEAKPLAEKVNDKIWSIYVSDKKIHEVSKRIARIIKGVESALTIKNFNLGLIGGISSWLVYSKTNPIIVRKKLGVNVVNISLDDVYRLYAKVNDNDVLELLEKITGKAENIEVSRNRLIDALKLYVSLKKIINEKKLNAITIKCFDIIMSIDTTACLSLSMLNSEGIVAGCEGDVPSALAMILLNRVSNKPVFMGNPSKIEDNKLMIAHCTAPLAAGSYILKTHFETGKGVGIAVKYPRGAPVTLLRFSPNLDIMRIIRGRIEKGEPESNLHCRTQITIALDVDASVLLEKSMGNHYALVIGDYIVELESFAKAIGIKTEVF